MHTWFDWRDVLARMIVSLLWCWDMLVGMMQIGTQWHIRDLVHARLCSGLCSWPSFMWGTSVRASAFSEHVKL